VLLKDVLKNETINVWKKKSFFSKLEPDWEAVRKIGLKINANPIVMIAGDIGAGTYHYYLYDSENNRIYSKTVKSYYATFSKDVQSAAGDLMKEFFNH
jgi:hypothetical protein